MLDASCSVGGLGEVKQISKQQVIQFLPSSFAPRDDIRGSTGSLEKKINWSYILYMAIEDWKSGGHRWAHGHCCGEVKPPNLEWNNLKVVFPAGLPVKKALLCIEYR